MGVRSKSVHTRSEKLRPNYQSVKYTSHDRLLRQIRVLHARRGHYPSVVACVSTVSGTIPPQLGGLTALQKLSLYKNQLTGESWK